MYDYDYTYSDYRVFIRILVQERAGWKVVRYTDNLERAKAAARQLVNGKSRIEEWSGSEWVGYAE